jgi:hypothetical protein
MSDIIEFSEEYLDEYANMVGFAISKGTANVSASDKKKLKGLLRHYGKMKHPFTACVRDNRKRFGSHTEEYCAVLKDLIVGSTKWRGKGKKFTPKKFAEDSTILNDFLTDIDRVDIPEGFAEFLSNLTDDDIAIMTNSIIPEDEDTVELSDERPVLAEMFFDATDTTEGDGVIWKTVMREGVWKYSPGPGGVPMDKPIQVVASGKSDPNKFVISLEELKENFEAQAKEHVTIPTSHEDKVYQNTGFVDQLKIEEDAQGRKVLKAAHRFTDKNILAKVKDGSIANVSAGVLWNHLKKETGQKFNAVLGHVALTNSPWLNGMEPFEAMNASEELEIISFSEENDSAEEVVVEDTTTTVTDEKGGVIVSTLSEETKNTFFEDLGLSEDEVRERLSRLESVEAENKKNSINAKCNAWQEEGKSPAIVKEAKAALLSDNGTYAINFSEDGQTKTLSLSEVVERLVTASPSVQLSEDKVTDEDATDEAPEVDTEEENLKATFTDEEKVEIGVMIFDQAKSEAEAIATVLAARKSD